MLCRDYMMCPENNRYGYEYLRSTEDQQSSHKAQMTLTDMNCNEAKIRLEYLFHLQRLSICHMHQGDFIIVIHNMYEKQKAVSIGYLRFFFIERETEPLQNILQT
jgi:hypothetical protein